VESWNPSEYLRFGDERTRPSVDLAARIAVERPATVIDLGCGPGNSTRVLTQRWPQACVTGLDRSIEMITAARTKYPRERWLLADIADWHPDAAFDVVFSNAALQWLPNHGPLVERLFSCVSSGGALAFQIPSADFARVRAIIQRVALGAPWSSRMTGALAALTMERPGFYYDHLAPSARSIDMWETEYLHVMESAPAIVEWMASTGLRPFLEALESESESEQFLGQVREGVCEVYPAQIDGRVLFPFKRTFVIAYA